MTYEGYNTAYIIYEGYDTAYIIYEGYDTAYIIYEGYDTAYIIIIRGIRCFIHNNYTRDTMLLT